MRLSIITVCFNAAATIEATLRSVADQRDADIEFVVVDGGSSDGTLAILERYEARIDQRISEPDDGIFDAMNKGVALSTGDVLYFLNADDSFVDPWVLRDVARAFANEPGCRLLYGNVVLQGAPPDLVYGAVPFTRWTVREFLNNSFCHQALFARRSLFDQIGAFDARSRYAADYEWVIKAFKAAPRSFHYIDRKIANYYYRGRSFANVETTRREVRGFYFKYFRNASMAWFYLRYIFARGLKKRLLRQEW